MVYGSRNNRFKVRNHTAMLKKQDDVYHSNGNNNKGKVRILNDTKILNENDKTERL